MLMQYLYCKIMEISSLSDWEYISLVGYYNSIFEDNTDTNNLLDRGYSAEAIKMLEAKLETKYSNKEVRSLNLVFNCRLDRFKVPYFNLFHSLYQQYEKHGILPFEGPLVDQPARIIEVFNVFDQLKLEREMNLQKEQLKNVKRNS